MGVSRAASRRGSRCPRRGCTPTRRPARRDSGRASLTHRRPEAAAAATPGPGARAAWRRPLPCRTASSRGAGPPRRPPGSAPRRRARPPPGPAPHPAARRRLLPSSRRRSGGGEPAGGSTLPAGRGDRAAGRGRSAALRSLLIPPCGAAAHPAGDPRPRSPHSGPDARNECRRRGCLRRAWVISPRQGSGDAPEPAGGAGRAPGRAEPRQPQHRDSDGPQSRDPPHPPADLS